MSVTVLGLLPPALRCYAHARYPGKEALWLRVKTTHSNMSVPFRYIQADVRAKMVTELAESRRCSGRVSVRSGRLMRQHVLDKAIPPVVSAPESGGTGDRRSGSVEHVLAAVLKPPLREARQAQQSAPKLDDERKMSDTWLVSQRRV